MSHSIRRALFYTFCALFLILGTGIVLFAQGWRMDFPSFRISKVGGIYVRAYPESATITLNGKSIPNQAGFLSHGTLLSDLFPKTYRLALTAPGYDDWHENVSVAPALVATEKYAVLVPQKGTAAASGTVLNFAAKGGGLLIETANGAISSDGALIASGKLIAAPEDLSAAIFLDGRGTYRLSVPGSSSTINLSAAFMKGGLSLSPADFLAIDPANDATVIAANGERILSFDGSRSKLSVFETAPAGEMLLPSVAVSPAFIAWARFTVKTNTSQIVIYDRSAGAIADDSVMLAGKISKLSWLPGNIFGILTSGRELYSYDPSAKNLQKSADDVVDFSETQDGAALAALEENSLEIFSESNPVGYERFHLPDNGSAASIAWYHDGDHLFVIYPDHVSLLDLQDTSLANFTTVAQGTMPEYDPATNALYLIGPYGDLLRFDFAK